MADLTNMRRMAEGLAGLDPRRDVTASRGMARREHAVTPITFSLLGDVVDVVATPVIEQFGKGRRLLPRSIDAIAEAFLRHVDGRHGHAVVASSEAITSPTRTQPKRRQHECVRLLVARDGEGFSLAVAQVMASRKHVGVEVRDTVVGWTRHSSERFYERADRMAEASSRDIGGALAGMFATTCAAIGVVGGEGRSRTLALPCHGGLLLGEVSFAPEAEWRSRALMVKEHAVGTARSRPASVVPCPYGGGAWIWTGRTFVGPDELGADQVGYAMAWSELLSLPEVARANRDALDILHWTPRPIDDLRAIIEAMAAPIRAILDAPAFADVNKGDPVLGDDLSAHLAKRRGPPRPDDKAFLLRTTGSGRGWGAVEGNAKPRPRT